MSPSLGSNYELYSYIILNQKTHCQKKSDTINSILVFKYSTYINKSSIDKLMCGYTTTSY